MIRLAHIETGVLPVLALASWLCQPASASAYQSRVNLLCASFACTGSSAAVPTGKTLTLHDISCYVGFASGTASSGIGTISRKDLPGGFTREFAFGPAAGLIAVAPVQTTQFTVPAGKRLQVQIAFDGGTAGQGHCSLNGTLLP
jgi:hypothetical protein